MNENAHAADKAAFDLLLIDINAIGYACAFQPDLARKHADGTPTSALNGVPVSLWSIIRDHPGATPVVLWDGPTSWRLRVLPSYKDRSGDNPEKTRIREQYHAQQPALKELLASAGVAQVFNASKEADDLAGDIVRVADPALRILLVSRDSDWYQAVRPGVSFLNLRSRAVLTEDALFGPDGKYDSIEQYLTAKSLAGDTTDGIEGIRDVGITSAVKLLRLYGSLDGLYAATEGRMSEALNAKAQRKTEQKIASAYARALYQRNRTLIDWAKAPPSEDDTKIVLRPCSEEAVDALMARYALDDAKVAIHSILQRAPSVDMGLLKHLKAAL